jgi:hypothetical protein
MRPEARISDHGGISGALTENSEAQTNFFMLLLYYTEYRGRTSNSHGDRCGVVPHLYRTASKSAPHVVNEPKVIFPPNTCDLLEQKKKNSFLITT